MDCPKCGNKDYSLNGSFMHNGVKLRKYKCKKCGLNYSNQTVSETVNQHRPELNDPIIELFAQGLSQREIALRLGCARRTVQLKLIKYEHKIKEMILLNKKKEESK